MSTSFPFLKIAKDFEVSYRNVILIANIVSGESVDAESMDAWAHAHPSLISEIEDAHGLEWHRRELIQARPAEEK